MRQLYHCGVAKVEGAVIIDQIQDSKLCYVMYVMYV